MGDKAAARRTMKEVGVPIVPGTDAISDAEEALAAAREIGFPVLIKAAAGGGGKGMRVAKDADEFVAASSGWRATRRRRVRRRQRVRGEVPGRPRHIEFQILGDQHGRWSTWASATARSSGATRS
jgi:acetyl-CoA carboxylase, biotin carboxylase subunit